jgi:hypothetical protein
MALALIGEACRQGARLREACRLMGLGGVTELGIEAIQAGRRIGLQHAFAFHQKKRRRGQTPDHVGLRIVFFGQ